MTSPISRRTRPAHLIAMTAAVLALAGCAGSPSAPRPVVAPVKATTAAAPATEQIIEMAPIPNPTEPVRTEHSERSRRERRSHREEREAAEKTAPHAAPAVDHARAAHLRAQGLEQLDRGQIRRAVELLQAASQLDPDDVLIRHDLERALKISKAVDSRR